MRAVAAGLLADRDQHVLAALHALDLPLEDPQLGRVDLIVGGVDRDQRRPDALEPGRGVVVARGVERVQHVVGIEARELSAHQLVEEAIRGLSRRRLRLPGQRAAGHEQQRVDRRRQPPRLRRVLAVLPLGIVPDGIDDHAPHHAVAPGDLHREAGERQEGVHEVGVLLAPHPGVHASHRRAHHEPQMVHTQPFGEQPILRGDHVVVGVPREARVQPVARLGGFARGRCRREGR